MGVRAHGVVLRPGPVGRLNRGGERTEGVVPSMTGCQGCEAGGLDWIKP